ncbi:MAG: LacI family DNA-binding transcriptional regulator [Marinibacterium sp.]
MPRPTVHDIAKEAGVSLATVDRVLNARPGVRDKTVARVRAAIDRLGYVRDPYAANLARQRQYRFACVLPDGEGQFVGTLRKAVNEAMLAQQAERISISVLRVPEDDPHAAVRRLRALGPDRYDGVAIMLPETPQIRDAIARMKQAGLAVVALVSDLPNSPRDHFVGINNHSAGRTAGVLMGRFVRASAGAILVATHSLQARDSIERRLGFDQVMASEFPALRVLPTLESHGNSARMSEIVRTALVAHPGIVGVYSMGSGNRALVRGIEAAGRAEVTVIAHELTPVTRSALIDGQIDAVITQNVGHLVRSALRVLRAKVDGTAIFEAQERIRTDIVIKENLP